MFPGNVSIKCFLRLGEGRRRTGWGHPQSEKAFHRDLIETHPGRSACCVPGKALYQMLSPTWGRVMDRLGVSPVGKSISWRFIAISELGKLGNNRKSHNGEAQHGNTMEETVA